jgi:hypothetical protein
MTGHPTNPIVNTEARLPDGSVVAYRDTDPSHIRRGNFQHIMDSHPLDFTVTLQDGSQFSVDLVSGRLYAGDGDFVQVDPPPTTPLTLIYYKRMEGSVGPSGASTRMVFFAVGWQTTVDGRNVRAGLKVFPDEIRYEVTEDI